MLGVPPRGVLAAVLGLLLGATAVGSARAVQLSAEKERATEHGYSPIEELSYEVIIEATDGYHAQVSLRVALHNTSAVDRDMVLSLALPRSAELEGVAVARDGQWSDGRTTGISSSPARRDPGTIYARQLPPESHGDLPGAEVVGFNMESGATIQVELRLRVHPRLQGDRWELELPSRGRNLVALAADRRVLVKGLRRGETFTVDGDPNGNNPFMLTRPEDTVSVSWPAHLRGRSSLDARYEVMPAGDTRRGDFALYLNLGHVPAGRPDHIVVLVDRSKSTGARMQRETLRVIENLFDALPRHTTFDAIGFARRPARLLTQRRRRAPNIRDKQARNELAAALDANHHEQGTDLAAALAMAGEVVRDRQAKKPLILIVTDGMLPGTGDPDAVREAFERTYLRGERKAKRRRPEVVFLVDDPLLVRTGLQPDHPVTRVAAALGARISYETLSQHRADTVLGLLSAPRVLGDLEVPLPEGMRLSRPLPPGLVAGNFVVAHGTFVGPAARQLLVRGKFGNRHVSRRAPARIRPPRPQAVVATPGTENEAALQRAVREGFARPPWYSRLDERTAQQGITRAGRGGVQRKGRLSSSIFQYYLRTRVLPRAQVCYNRSLQRNQIQQGRAILDFEVGKGEVMLARAAEVELDEPDTKLVACLTEAAWALDIPAGKLDDRVYRVRYPLTFTAPADGKPRTVGDPLGEGTVELLLDVAPRRSPPRAANSRRRR